MYLPWKFAQVEVKKRATIRDDDSCTPSITAAAAEVFESCITEHLREKVQIRMNSLIMESGKLYFE